MILRDRKLDQECQGGSKAEAKEFLKTFVSGLAEVSKHYSRVRDPVPRSALSQDETIWLTKIRHTGNVATFLPLLVATRNRCEEGRFPQTEYVALLQALECYAYRVFHYAGRRSNAGLTTLYLWAHEIFTGTASPADISKRVYALLENYAPQDKFLEANQRPSKWYYDLRCLKYTLFEYELFLLQVEGKGKEPHLRWDDLSDTTIEHILPQTPEQDSQWMRDWSKEDFDACIHDIGNLVLTQNNSNYLRFEFSRKRGKQGQSPSYSDSDIRQERRVARCSAWTRKEFEERRKELIDWINERWKSEPVSTADLESTVVEPDDGDETT